MKVYSYRRVSTLAQLAGHGPQRQSDDAERYAASIGAELDTTLHLDDLGRSAFRAENIDLGALGGFLRLAEDGLIESGSTLVVENLDRISRQTARKAVRILERLCEAGVNVYTCSDQRLYTLENLDSDPLNLIWAVLLFSRAHEDSSTRSRRGRAAWDAKRETIRDDIPTARVPAWIRVVGRRTVGSRKVGGRFVVIPERGVIVRELFQRVAAGESTNSITRRLNERQVPPWGPARRGNRPMWHRSYLVKLLRNRSVLGEFQPHRRTGRSREPVGDVVPDYFPAVITQEEWDATHAVLGRGAGQVGPSLVHNVFAGLARCSHCGASVVMRNMGRSTKWRYLVCRQGRYRNGECWGKNRRARLDNVEERLIARAQHIPSFIAGRSLAQDIDAARDVAFVIEEGIEYVTSAIARTGSRELERRLLDLEQQREAAQAGIRALRERAEASGGAIVRARLAGLRDALQADPLDRPACNLALRAAIDRAVVNFEDRTVRLEWRHDAEPFEYDYLPGSEFATIDDDIPDLLAQQPMTIREIAGAVHVGIGDARNAVRRLVGKGKIRKLGAPVRGREGRYGAMKQP